MILLIVASVIAARVLYVIFLRRRLFPHDFCSHGYRFPSYGCPECFERVQQDDIRWIREMRQLRLEEEAEKKAITDIAC